MEEDTVTLQEIFRFRVTGADDGHIQGVFESTGLRPRMLARLSEMGLAVPEEIGQLFPDPRIHGGW